MVLLQNPLDTKTATLGEFAAPFKNIFGSTPEYVGADFAGGFVIQELLADADEKGGSDGLKVQLLGEWMPHQPFKWGGQQKLVKEYYPGDPEPTVQVLGGREDELKITGRFKVKRLRVDPEDGRELPSVLCDSIDTIRKRGNLVKLTLGEWTRYGFLEACNFTMKTKADIEYEITFFLIGDKPPSQCKLAAEGFDVPLSENQALIKAGAELEALATKPFDGINLGLFGQLNALLGAVATGVSVLTKFVDGVVSAAEDAEKFANRAVGLIKYVQAQIAVFKRRVGQLSLPTLGSTGAGSSGSTATSNAKATDDIKAGKYILKVQTATTKGPALSPAQLAAAKTKTAAYSKSISTAQVAAAMAGGQSIDKLLQQMLKKFEGIANSVPRFRHLVRSGDTLQTISMKYYKTADGWDKIYQHNKLTTTALTPGTILEIPKQ